MLLIRGYYFFFQSFVFTLVGLCELLHWIRKPNFSWVIKVPQYFRSKMRISYPVLRQVDAHL